MPEVALSPLSPTETATVRSVLNVSPSVAAVTVTVMASPPSGTLTGVTSFGARGVRVITVVSSSVSVTVSGFTVMPVDVPATVIDSSPSMILSWVGVRLNVPVALVSPCLMVMSKAATAA